MKKMIVKTQKFRALARILENHSDAFTGKPLAEAAMAAYITKSQALIDQMEGYVYATGLYQPRMQSRLELRKMMNPMIQLSIMLATRKEDSIQLNTLKKFNSEITKSSDAQTIIIAHHLIAFLRGNEAFANDLGISPESVLAFEASVNAFDATLTATQGALRLRRTAKTALNTLMIECNNMLNNELDRYVKANETLYPEFSISYMRIRKARKRKRSNTIAAVSDISGTVINSITGKPIAFATINLLEQAWAIETDVDGHYIFDELEQGSYTVSCHANGFVVPENVSFNLSLKDSAVVNFSLNPVMQPGN